MSARKTVTAKPPEPPQNPLVRSNNVSETIERIHAFAIFLWMDADHAGTNGLMRGEEYGRGIAHEVLVDALAWLEAHGGTA